MSGEEHYHSEYEDTESQRELNFDRSYSSFITELGKNTGP